MNVILDIEYAVAVLGRKTADQFPLLRGHALRVDKAPVPLIEAEGIPVGQESIRPVPAQQREVRVTADVDDRVVEKTLQMLVESMKTGRGMKLLRERRANLELAEHEPGLPVPRALGALGDAQLFGARQGIGSRAARAARHGGFFHAGIVAR